MLLLFYLVWVCYLVQVNQDTSDRVQEAGQLVVAVVLPIRLSQVHLLTALNQLRVHQVHVLWANFLAWLQKKHIFKMYCQVSFGFYNCDGNEEGNKHTAAKNPYPRMAMDSSLCVESMVLMMPQNFCMKNFNLLLCSSIFSATSSATLKWSENQYTAVVLEWKGVHQ